ncbi:MAG: methyltransferase [Deinococcota bacterium]
MDWQTVLTNYSQVDVRKVGAGLQFASKPGLPFYPDVPPATLQLLQLLMPPAGQVIVDASHSQGLLAQALQHAGAAEVWVVTGSSAALTTSQHINTNLQYTANPLWQMPPNLADAIYLVPSTALGDVRVEAEVQGAYRLLKPGGMLTMALSKRQGAKRYEQVARNLFGDLTSLSKTKDWQLSRCVKADAPSEPQVIGEPQTFEVVGLELQAHPGVFAAGKLDGGTACLLDVLTQDGLLNDTTLLGKRVLDLGCGYGLLALKAALAGAAVTALDDDLLAVKSTAANASHYGLDVRCLHSDVGSALTDEVFDVVLMNPPFHVGKQVDMHVPYAFLATAIKHLADDGVVYIVANAALDYETPLTTWGRLKQVHQFEAYKVLVWQHHK